MYKAFPAEAGRVIGTLSHFFESANNPKASGLPPTKGGYL